MRPRIPQLHVRKSIALGGAILLAASGAAVLLAPGASNASSHREAPLIAGDPQADNTDVYAFQSPDAAGTTTLIANWIPFEEPNGGPNFYAWGTDTHYNIKIDNNGDGKADITYQWEFTNHYRDAAHQFLYNTGPVKSLDDPNLNFYQTYTVTKIDGAGASTTVVSNAIAAPSNVGAASIPDYNALRNQATNSLAGGGKEYTGQSDDPFFLDLRVFDLLYGANLKEAGHDTLSGYNVNNITLQVPTKDLALKGDATRNPVLGIWSTTDRKSAVLLGGGKETKTGNYVQVSRLGNPLVNEAVIPLDLKDAFNSIGPDSDHTVAEAVNAVTDPIVPKLINSVYGLPAPATPRNDLVEIFLTGISKDQKTLAGGPAPIQADLNSPTLNKDADKTAIIPAEELRLNTAVPVTASPNRLGVLANDFQGFPNGRRLGDDVVDIALQALEGAAQSGKLVAALAAGDGVNTNDHAFGASFPYVALPNTQAVNQAAPAGTNNGPSAAPVLSQASNHGAVTLAIKVDPALAGKSVTYYVRSGQTGVVRPLGSATVDSSGLALRLLQLSSGQSLAVYAKVQGTQPSEISSPYSNTVTFKVN